MPSVEFVMEGRDAIEAAFARHDAGVVIRWDEPVVIALDVARSFAGDQNVATVAQGSRVLQLHAWHSRDLVTTTEKVLEVRNRYQVSHRGGVTSVRLLADASGIGGGVIDIGKDRGARIAEYWGWNPSPDSRFANIRAAHHWHVRTLLERDEVVLPRGERLAEDLLALEWTQDSRGRILMLSKDDLRKSLGRSTDRGDGCVMALKGLSAVPLVLVLVALAGCATPQLSAAGCTVTIVESPTLADLEGLFEVGMVSCSQGMNGQNPDVNMTSCMTDLRNRAAALNADVVTIVSQQVGRDGCPNCVSMAGTAYQRVR